MDEKPAKNYSAEVRDNKAYKIIDANEFISILKGEKPQYIKHYDWIEIENHIITDFIHLDGLECSYKIRLKNCYFEDFFSFEGAIFDDMVSIVDCKFEKSFHLDKCEFKDKLEILEIHITVIWINGGSFDELVISGYTDLFRFWIRGGTLKQFTFTGRESDIPLEEFVFYNTGQVEGNIKLEKVRAEKISINGGNKSNSELYFENIQADRFTFRDFTNNGTLKIFGLQPINIGSSYFQTVGSNLGKAQFYRVDFAKFSEFVFVDSYLAEVNLINCEWGQSFRGIETSDEYSVPRDRTKGTEIEAKQLREIFRQLKFVYDKQGDRIHENQFYSHEMNTYNSLIRWKQVWFKPWSERFWEKIIIMGSNYFSKYGTSFIIPLVAIIVFNSIILLILIHFFNYQNLELAGFSTGEKGANRLAIGEFFKLINPVHKMDESLTGWAVFWDLVARVSASYFLYNLIRASRRFLK